MGALLELKDKIAIVTGGGTGIGRAIATEMAREGANVVVCSRKMERVKSDVQDAISALGRRCLAVTIDVRKPEDVDNMVKMAIDEFGRIDILVNNAGATFQSPFEDITPNGWDAIVGTNLKGTYLCCRAVGKVMIQQKRGVIINISSIVGVDGAPLLAAYGAAKAGVINLTKSLAIEWAKHNIRVNCIAPGPIITEAVLEVLKKDGLAEPLRNPRALERWGQPVEIARVVIFLASEASSFIAGETICVAGGPLVQPY